MVLAKENRLCLKKDFELLKKKGKMINSASFGMLILPDFNLKGKSIFGFIVSKKVDRRATVRNRIKRILAEAVRLNEDLFTSGYKVLFLAKRSLVNKKTPELEKEIRVSIDKL